MKGYTDRILVMLPDHEVMQQRSESNRLDFIKALTNLQRYAKDNDIQLYALNSDLFARDLDNSIDFEYYTVFPIEDIVFVQNWCEGYNIMHVGEAIDEDQFDVQRKKIKIPAGLTPEERLPYIIKRRNLGIKYVVDRSKVVVNMTKGCKIPYTPKPKDGGIPMLINVEVSNFTAASYYNGREIARSEIFQRAECNKSLLNWY